MRTPWYPLLFAATLAITAIGCTNAEKTPADKPATTSADSAPPPIESRYHAMPIPGAGVISGRVLMSGPAPELPDFEIAADAAACGPAAKNNRLLSDKGGIGGAVIYLEGVTGGKPMPELPASALTIDQKGCQYTPHVLVAPLGSTVTFTNSDDVPHNVRVENLSSDSILMNRAQPSRGNRDPFQVRTVGPVSVGCDYHPWMSAYVFGMDSPYYTVTASDGSFALEGVPPGNYTLKLWLNGLDARPKKDNQGRVIRYAYSDPYISEKQVTLLDSQNVSIDFKLILPKASASR